ncbi:aldehyde dehydrogenase family protein [Nocardia farcinica]|uniref:aldehyde dehydrogenase family protein n=1 Tax=Nocardia farcinica TaxID=37329 RepID=UPI002453FF5C|nr:aldehyde dehydrogenase family protein [Nocardia farcinica]
MPVSVCTDLPQSATADIERAFATARAAQREWARRPVRERVAVLRRLHDIVLAEQDTILDIVRRCPACPSSCGPRR